MPVPPVVRRWPVAAPLAALLLPVTAWAAAPAAPTVAAAGVAARQAQTALDVNVTLNRALPVTDLDADRGRRVCVVVGRVAIPHRDWRVCVSRVSGGRLQARIAPLDPDGAAGPGRRLAAKVTATGRTVRIRAEADALGVVLGRKVRVRADVRWQDGGGCEQTPDGCASTAPRQGFRTVRTVAVPALQLRRQASLQVLTTGDSMIQLIDTALEQRLEARRPQRITVRRESHISTGITKPFMLDWPTKARAQVRTVRPDVTIMFLGANDGFSMRPPGGSEAACCGASWVREYERRVRGMMATYRRGGRSLVYWLTLPVPRRDAFQPIYRAVNRAVRAAARSFPYGVGVVDLDKVFTPGGRYRSTMVFRGRVISPRQADGTHLSVSGAGVAATVIADRLRADRVLR